MVFDIWKNILNGLVIGTPIIGHNRFWRGTNPFSCTRKQAECLIRIAAIGKNKGKKTTSFGIKKKPEVIINSFDFDISFISVPFIRRKIEMRKKLIRNETKKQTVSSKDEW